MYLERAAGLSRLSGWAGAPVFRRLSHCGLLPGEGAYGMCDLHLFYRLCPAAKRYAPEPAVGRGGRAGAPGAAGPECPCAGQVAVAAVLAGDSQCFQQHSDHGYCGGSVSNCRSRWKCAGISDFPGLWCPFVAAAGGGRQVPHGGPVLFGWRHHQRCAAASGNSGGELAVVAALPAGHGAGALCRISGVLCPCRGFGGA